MRKLLSVVVLLLLAHALFQSPVQAQTSSPCPPWEYTQGFVECRAFDGGTESLSQVVVRPWVSEQAKIYLYGLFDVGVSTETFSIWGSHRDDDAQNGYNVYRISTSLPSQVSVVLQIVDLYDGTFDVCYTGRPSGLVNITCQNQGYLPQNAAAILTVFSTGTGTPPTGESIDRWGAAIRRGTTVIPTPTRTRTPTTVPGSPTPTPEPPSPAFCPGSPSWLFYDGDGITTRSQIDNGEEYMKCNPNSVTPAFLIPQQGGSAVSFNTTRIVTGDIWLENHNTIGISYSGRTWDFTANEFFFGAADGATVLLEYWTGGGWMPCGSANGNTGDILCILPGTLTHTKLRVTTFSFEEAGGYTVQVTFGGAGSDACPTIGGLNMTRMAVTNNCCVNLHVNSSFTNTSGNPAYQINFPVSQAGARGQEIGILSYGTLASYTYELSRFGPANTTQMETCTYPGETCSNPTGQSNVGSLGPHSFIQSFTANGLSFAEHSLRPPFGQYDAQPFDVMLCSPVESQATATPTVAPTVTRTPTQNGAPTATRTPTLPPNSQTNTPTPNLTWTPTKTRTPTRTPTGTRVASATPNPSWTATRTPLGAPPPTWTPTITPTFDPNASPTPTLVPTVTRTPTPYFTPTPYPFPPGGEGSGTQLDWEVITGQLTGLFDLLLTRYPFYLVPQAWDALGFGNVANPQPLSFDIPNPVPGGTPIEVVIDLSPYTIFRGLSRWAAGIFASYYLLRKVYSLGIGASDSGTAESS